jgi:hypothetical protein
LRKLPRRLAFQSASSLILADSTATYLPMNINVGIDAYLRLREDMDELQSELAKTKQHYYDMRNDRDYLKAVLLEIANSNNLEQIKKRAIRTYESYD